MGSSDRSVVPPSAGTRILTQVRSRRCAADVTDIDEFDLLKWWKVKASTLSKMVKQYLAAPASSGTAGVERVFSSAGKMHADLRKSMKL